MIHVGSRRDWGGEASQIEYYSVDPQGSIQEALLPLKMTYPFLLYLVQTMDSLLVACLDRFQIIWCLKEAAGL